MCLLYKYDHNRIKKKIKIRRNVLLPTTYSIYYNSKYGVITKLLGLFYLKFLVQNNIFFFIFTKDILLYKAKYKLLNYYRWIRVYSLKAKVSLLIFFFFKFWNLFFNRKLSRIFQYIDNVAQRYLSLCNTTTILSSKFNLFSKKTSLVTISKGPMARKKFSREQYATRKNFFNVQTQFKFIFFEWQNNENIITELTNLHESGYRVTGNILLQTLCLYTNFSLWLKQIYYFCQQPFMFFFIYYYICLYFFTKNTYNAYIALYLSLFYKNNFFFLETNIVQLHSSFWYFFFFDFYYFKINFKLI